MSAPVSIALVVEDEAVIAMLGSDFASRHRAYRS